MPTSRRFRIQGVAFALLTLVVPSQTLAAQDPKPPSRTFTLQEAVDFALKNYPAIRAAMEQVSAARGGVALARTSYLPRADLLWQSNRATRNNIFGQLFPQPVIPSISGPVLATTSNDSVWGSAGGLLFSWQPFDFGYRRATVRAAKATQDRTDAEVSLTRLDVAAAAAEAFLTLLAAQEKTRAARADVDRRQVFAKSVHVLVTNQLRPGADASRADAELAAARIQLIQAEQAERLSRAVLAQTLGTAGTEVRIEAGSLLTLPPGEGVPSATLAVHPLAVVEKGKVEESVARTQVFGREYYPQFHFQSAVAGRGSGAHVDGTTVAGLNGLGLERYNWAVGMTVTFPLFDFASIHARRKIEAANTRREEARYDQTLQDLTGQLEKANAVLDGARQVAQNTPIQLQAARNTETQSSARYRAGLATIVEVADAQRLLVQAEIDDALAKLNVWRSMVLVAAAQGDLQPVMQFLHSASPGGH